MWPTRWIMLLVAAIPALSHRIATCCFADSLSTAASRFHFAIQPFSHTATCCFFNWNSVALSPHGVLVFSRIECGPSCVLEMYPNGTNRTVRTSPMIPSIISIIFHRYAVNQTFFKHLFSLLHRSRAGRKNYSSRADLNRLGGQV